MKNGLRHSLPVQALASVIAIAMLCFISAIGSGVLAWVSQADAQAINTAGSIRMATYRIKFQTATDFDNLSSSDLSVSTETKASKQDFASAAAALEFLLSDMEQRLASLRDYQQYHGNEHDGINRQLHKIERQWFDELKPSILANDQSAFYRASNSYVENVDDLVDALQYRNEQRQTWQQLLQVASLLLTIIIMLVGFYKLQNNVLLPVQRLIKANSQFRQGKSETRVSISGYREFKKLGNSFNAMASTIETYQQSLENEVQTKTQHLTQANQALGLFYDFSKQLTISPVSLYKLDKLITDFGTIFPHLDLTLCIQNDILNGKDSIALHDDKMKELCTKLNCDNCFIKSNIYTKTYSISHQNFEFGELKVRPKSILMMNNELAIDTKDSADPHLERHLGRIQTLTIDGDSLQTDYLESQNTDNDELIISLTNLVGTALSLRKQRQQEHQLILLEERSTIARELHDSLAQSLSYLKIQLSVLEKRLEQSSDKCDKQTVLQSIDQIKLGLNSAYQQLRDLLVTFRLSIDSNNFDEALHETTDEFATRGHFNVQVNNSIMSLNLNANEQVHLIQILREALSNISRHAMAENVIVDLSYDESNYVVMIIRDDGVGIIGDVDQTQHHGLMIMQERAHNLGGELSIMDNKPSGTKIIVKFSPNFFD
ncbi:histidine kinase [Psychrobacter sp. AH5]|uniref:histidine kinase n=1 Tax=Psychrobacter sp. AH5 TaxID=2937433 RepID=UPI0033400F5B